MDLFMEQCPALDNPTGKICIIGAGKVGTAIAYALLIKGGTSELVLIDCNESKVKGEVLDLRHGLSFVNNCIIKGGSDYTLTKGSLLCILTININDIDSIVKNVMTFSPNTLFIVVSKPVELICQKIVEVSGLPWRKVIGLGTIVESGRLGFILSERHKAASSDHFFCLIGHHKHPRLLSLNEEECPSDLEVVKAIQLGDEVCRLKGGVHWSIGLATSELCYQLLNSISVEATVVTNAKDLIGQDLWISLPVVMGQDGVQKHLLSGFTLKGFF